MVLAYGTKKNNFFHPQLLTITLINWVAASVKITTKVLNVMWFGGEPLMAVDQISYLSKAFLEIKNAKGINYYSNIITNGYLLNEKNVDKLMEHHIKSCMVTIDGPEDIHDSRRMLKNGGKTWRIILDNVKLALNKGMAVTIRINVDNSNIDSIDRLLTNLDEQNILNEVGYFFGVITQFGSACSSIDDRLLSMEETERVLKQKKIMEVLSRAKNFKYRIPADFVGCVATSKHSYVVNPNGDLYKCTKTISNPAEMCGNIDNPDPTHPNFVKWLDVDNFHVESCTNCSMLPVCRGRICAFDVMNNSEKYESCNHKETHLQYLTRLTNLYQNKKNDQ